MSFGAVRRHNRDMAAAQAVAELIRSDHVRDISFMYGDTMILPGSWEVLADALTSAPPHMHVAVDRREVPRRADAAYASERDTIYLKSFISLKTAGGRGLAVHECVHALQDRVPRKIPSYEAEGAAYLALAWYHVNAGSVRRSKTARQLEDMVGRLKAYRAGLSLNMPAIVTMADRVVLDQVVAKKKYEHREYEQDGWAFEN